MQPRVLFLGDNGHSEGRLAPARQALAGAGAPFDLVNLPLPGFEDTPRAASLDACLQTLTAAIAAARGAGPALLYGTGLGGLLALCLRARGAPLDLPVILQAPLLWGLERRLLPRVMRFPPARWLLLSMFGWPRFQAWFVGKHFERPLDPALRAAFFRGYAARGAAGDYVRWLNPRLLRRLEVDFRQHPEALRGITIWWGGRDRILGWTELAWTRAALETDWPVRAFPAWGHYPTIDDPDGWVRSLAEEWAAVASAAPAGHNESLP